MQSEIRKIYAESKAVQFWIQLILSNYRVVMFTFPKIDILIEDVQITQRMLNEEIISGNTIRDAINWALNRAKLKEKYT